MGQASQACPTNQREELLYAFSVTPTRTHIFGIIIKPKFWRFYLHHSPPEGCARRCRTTIA